MNLKKPTIIHIRNSDFYGSPERLIAGQMIHLSDFDNICVTFRKHDSESELYNKMRSSNLSVFQLETNKAYDNNLGNKLADLLESQSADLIVSHDYKSNFYGHRANKKLKLPHIAYFHGWTSEDFKVKIYNMIDRRVMRKLDKVITVSAYSADLLATQGVPRKNIEVVYNAIEKPDESSDSRVPLMKPYTIAVIGRLSHEKGVHIFLKSLANLKGNVQPFKALIIGDGPDRTKLEKLSESLGFSEIVSFEGFRKDIDKIYSELSFLVIPSLSEGHPLVILEAWKNKVGIISTRAGGIPEIIEDGRSGILVDIDNPSQLAEAVKKGLENIDLMNKYGETGFNLVREKYSYNVQAKRLSDIYHKALGIK